MWHPAKHIPSSHKQSPAEPVIISGFHNGLPPRRFCQTFLWSGLVSIAIALCGNRQSWEPSENVPFSLGLLFFGVMFVSLGTVLFKVRRDILRLSSSEQLCERMGLDEQALYRTAETQGVRPRYVVNGKEYYDPADFNASSQLLRASESPEMHVRTLLRSAHATELQNDRLLLRHSAEPSSSAVHASERGYPEE